MKKIVEHSKGKVRWMKSLHFSLGIAAVPLSLALALQGCASTPPPGVKPVNVAADVRGCEGLAGEYEYSGNVLLPGREAVTLLRFLGRMGDPQIDRFRIVIAPSSEFASLEFLGGDRVIRGNRVRGYCFDGMLVEEYQDTGGLAFGRRATRIVHMKSPSADLRVMVSSEGAGLVDLVKWHTFQGEGAAEFRGRPR